VSLCRSTTVLSVLFSVSWGAGTNETEFHCRGIIQNRQTQVALRKIKEPRTDANCTKFKICEEETEMNSSLHSTAVNSSESSAEQITIECGLSFNLSHPKLCERMNISSTAKVPKRMIFLSSFSQPTFWSSEWVSDWGCSVLVIWRAVLTHVQGRQAYYHPDLQSNYGLGSISRGAHIFLEVHTCFISQTQVEL